MKRRHLESLNRLTHLTALAILLPLWVCGQNISVRSFRSLSDDMTARVTAPVTDQNGNKCALIKVRTTQKGFVFEGDMLGVTKTKQEVGEIWVYIPAKAKRITIKHPKLGVLENYLYPESVEEASVYVMELTTSKLITTVIEDEIETAYLVIRSEPEGADVYIDETYMGETPFSKKVTVGNYKYRVEKNMHYPSAGSIEVTGENPREELQLTLEPAYGYANISTGPAGATVTINGDNIGQKAPFITQKLKKGTHKAIAKKPMYQPATKEFAITEGDTVDVQINLLPGFANITINTSPEADIYVNSEKVGFGTYTGRAMEGVHRFEAKKDKHYGDQKQMELKAGDEQTINLNLRARVGSLDITTSPIDAIIKLDGVEQGVTPNTLRGLLIGEHNLSLEKKDYTTINKIITIKEDETTYLKEIFAEEWEEEMVKRMREIEQDIEQETEAKKREETKESEEAKESPKKKTEPSDITIKGEKHRSRATALLYSAILPGAGQHYLSGKSGVNWGLGGTFYGLLSFGIIQNNMAAVNMRNYHNSDNAYDRDHYFNEAKSRYDNSRILFYSAGALWVANMAWTALIENKSKSRVKPIVNYDIQTGAVTYGLAIKLNK